MNIINISPVLATFCVECNLETGFSIGGGGLEIQNNTQKGQFRGADFWAGSSSKI